MTFCGTLVTLYFVNFRDVEILQHFFTAMKLFPNV